MYFKENVGLYTKKGIPLLFLRKRDSEHQMLSAIFLTKLWKV